MAGPGPATRTALARSLAAYAVLFLTGAMLAFGGPQPWLRSLGLGLMLPGAGFLQWAGGETSHAVIHALLAAAMLAASVASLAMWFATGNVLAPVAVWIIAAIAAAAMNHDEQWSGAPLAVVSAVFVLALCSAAALIFRRQRGQRLRRLINASLARHVEVAAPPKAAELTADDIALLRLLLDRALQPVDRFDGFDVIDQYQTAALRYQLNFAGYALSLFQHAHAPAFHGDLSRAQHALIAKHCERRVWSYWEGENRWGNLDSDPDPMGRDNVMFTGFVAAQIAAYEQASGECPFSAPASLRFAHADGRSFVHDLPGMIETLKRNIAGSRFALIACEPNWIFPLCNSIAFSAIARCDPAAWSRLAPEMVRAIDSEFLDAEGQLVTCRSRYLGLAIPALGGAAVQALPCLFLNASLPELARRQWLAERARIVRLGKLHRRRFWPVDTGNYRFSRASSFAATAAAAAEMGDTDLAAGILGMLDAEHPAVIRDGARHRPGVSVWAHAAELLARVGGPDRFRKLMSASPPAAGPVIAEASCRDVLPARATAAGGRLDCVLYPGHAPGPREIGLAGLVPNAFYRWNVGSFTADARGRARLTLVLEGRTEVTVVPAI